MTRWSVLGPGDPALAPRADRSAARAALAGAALVGDEQERVRAEVLAAVGRAADVLDRTGRPGHLTGSAAVIDPADGRLLVLFHRKLQRWLQPGGHADGDGNLAHVAWREATEETGIEGLEVITPAVHLDVHEVAPPGEDAHLHLDLRYVVLAPPGARPSGNHESEGLAWVAVEELGALGADAGLQALAARATQVLGEVRAAGLRPGR